jgi:hypothetical protein
MVIGRMYLVDENKSDFFEGQANHYDRIIKPDGSYCVG